MRELSEDGQKALDDIAGRYGVGRDAVEHLLMAVIAGHGNQAQFNHFELGGMGQWSNGGMTMVGDMFNNGLKAKVDGLCQELSNLLRSAGDGLLSQPSYSSQSQSQGGDGFAGSGHDSGVSLFARGSRASSNWWPSEFGHPASTGAQNDMRYAFFPDTSRLAIEIGGALSVYDTGDHRIGGFSQSQGSDWSMTFTSQHGPVRVADLKKVPMPSGDGSQKDEPDAAPERQSDVHEAAGQDRWSQPSADQPPSTEAPSAPKTSQQSAPNDRPGPSDHDAIFDKLERIAGLHAKGILTDDEYGAKKAELLSRL
ncbi:MAG: SHOCT domain-containing protein [Allorhizobium sp.]